MLRRSLPAAALLLTLSSGAVALANPVQPGEVKERVEPLPARLLGVDVRERLDEALPASVPFKDESGRDVRLGEYLDGQHPLIVTFNYSTCPMLCSLQLNGVTESLKQVESQIGRDYRVVTILLDPKETPETASRMQARYVGQYGRPGVEQGWHFLTGSEESIRAVASAVGFAYGYNEARKEYVHPAAIVVATPHGRVARYLYGLEYPAKTVKLSLVEASEGKIGSTVDRLLLYCFHYDETEGRYAPVASNIMRLSGGLTVVLLGAFLTTLWLRDAKKRRLIAASTTP